MCHALWAAVCGEQADLRLKSQPEGIKHPRWECLAHVDVSSEANGRDNETPHICSINLHKMLWRRMHVAIYVPTFWSWGDRYNYRHVTYAGIYPARFAKRKQFPHRCCVTPCKRHYRTDVQSLRKWERNIAAVYAVYLSTRNTSNKPWSGNHLCVAVANLTFPLYKINWGATPPCNSSHPEVFIFCIVGHP